MAVGYNEEQCDEYDIELPPVRCLWFTEGKTKHIVVLRETSGGPGKTQITMFILYVVWTLKRYFLHIILSISVLSSSGHKRDPLLLGVPSRTGLAPFDSSHVLEVPETRNLALISTLSSSGWERKFPQTSRAYIFCISNIYTCFSLCSRDYVICQHFSNIILKIIHCFPHFLIGSFWSRRLICDCTLSTSSYTPNLE